MHIMLYAILLLLPLPLLIFIIRRKHHLYCLPPFVALNGIYIFIIVGSFEVIRDERLFSDVYYYSLLLIITSFYFFYIVAFSFGKNLYINWRVINYSSADKRVIIPLLVCLWGFSFLMFYLYYQRHGLPAVFDVSLFDYNNLYKIRAEKSTDLPEGVHWYVLAFQTTPAFIFCYTYIWKHLIVTPKTKIIFYCNLPLVLFFSALTMHKSFFAYLVLYMLIIDVLIIGSFNLRKLLGYFAIGTSTIIIMLRFYLLDRGTMDVLKLVPDYFYQRIFVTYTSAHAYVVQIFPNNHDYFYGTAFGNPGHMLPYEPVNLSQFLGYWINGVLENYSSPSFSQGYANFGFVGLILIILFMFFQITVLQAVFKKFSKNPLFFSLYVLVVPQMLWYAAASIQQVISEIFILWCVAYIFIYYLLRNFMTGLVRHKRAHNTYLG